MDDRTHARYMTDVDYFITQLEAAPNSLYFVPLALAYNKLERYDETIALCISAVERFPSNCAVKTLLAEAFINKGELDEAKALLFDVTAEDDNNYKALKLLGKIFKIEDNTTEALRYLVGAYIRTPDDEEVRLMIEELGGSTDPIEIYEDRMRRRQQNALTSEEDEEIRTYQNIDQKIRNAEMIMAELASDTSIGKNIFIEDVPVMESEPKAEEAVAAPSLQTPTPEPQAFAPEEKKEEENVLFDAEELAKLNKALSTGNDKPEIISDNPEDFLPLVSEAKEEPEQEKAEVQNISINLEEGELSDDILNQLFAKAYEAVDILEAKENEEAARKAGEDSSTNDFLAALSADDTKTDSSEADFFAALASEDTKEGSSDADFFAALSSEAPQEAVAEEKSSDADFLAALSNGSEPNEIEAAQEKEGEVQAEITEETKDEEASEAPSIQEDIEKTENIEEELQAEAKEEEASEAPSMQEDIEKTENIEEELQAEAKEEASEAPSMQEDIEKTENIEEELQAEAKEEASEALSMQEDIEKTENIEEELQAEAKEEVEEAPIEEADALEGSQSPLETQPESVEAKEEASPIDMLKMSYEDMVGDDDYIELNDKDHEEELKEMGDYAPFTQSDIMDEIFSEAGMTSEDMVSNDSIEDNEPLIENNLAKDDANAELNSAKVEKLEALLSKVQKNKKSE